MHRTRRVARSIDSVGAICGAQAPRPFLCHVCRVQATSFSTSTVQSYPETGKVPLSERVRRRIWGTDQPPGQEDPYGGPGILDQVKAQNKAKKLAEQKPPATSAISATVPEDYEPATTWEGLERVGGYGNWWKENWDPRHPFMGFLPPRIMTDPEEVTAALHRALVEVFALKQAGEPLDGISKATPGADLTHDVQVIASDAGASLVFSENATLEDIVLSLAPQVEEVIEENHATESEQDIEADRSTEDLLHPEKVEETVEPPAHEPQPTESEEDVAADRSEEDPLEHQAPTIAYAELVASWDPSWLQVSLDDPEIKFAVIKRSLQLTGVRISDTSIRSITTAKSLLSHLVTPPKPRKLIEALEQKEEFLNLPNVKVHAKRITAIDKEKTVGRWKLIEEELENRGLPLTGYTRR
ncbi:uncharacterized protein BP5553_02041 [Venustampulla echinocandica]|uniref:Large ribosomal subunit protein mL50 n=1 Tax=Venustampulla echinocandica TaxID=2656787 RepID=A0A370U2Q3_9HELO|nr:uncharacterized protein BP5553_02041 [Venustampulla echinocandica]RDL42062.1 hypothetical protein BP5553_02041 [Venustampulla echinocandica]